MTDQDQRHPALRVEARAAKRLRGGHPWIFSNEFPMTAELKTLPPGTLIEAVGPEGHGLGLFMFNPHTLIAARRLARGMQQVDADFIAARLAAALDIRERLYDRPFYRLIHAEADGLPGLIVDCFGSTVVVQVNVAGMERLADMVIAAIEQVLNPGRIILKNDSSARTLEGLDNHVRVIRGAAAGEVVVEENSVTYLCDPVGGQKTGWFYDHRDNRAFMARLAKNQRVADFYTYAGGFALACARAGAGEVVAVDRSDSSLGLAARAAELNSVRDRLVFRRAEVFAEMERCARENEYFDVVIADPPAFVKSKKQLKAGAQGYRKLTRLAAALVRPGGVLMIASCSHHMTPDLFAEEVRRGLADVRRDGRILRMSGAGADHPVHPALPESAYLKAMVVAI